MWASWGDFALNSATTEQVYAILCLWLLKKDILLPESYNFQKFRVDLQNRRQMDAKARERFIFKIVSINTENYWVLTPVSSLTSLTAPLKISSDWYKTKRKQIPSLDSYTIACTYSYKHWNFTNKKEDLVNEARWYFPQTSECRSSVFLLNYKNL